MDKFVKEKTDSIVGILFGLAYGLSIRAANELEIVRPYFGEMTMGFIFLSPTVIGILTTYFRGDLSVIKRIVLPWIPCTIMLIVIMLIGLEGSICVIMGLPVFLVMSSIGGLFGYWIKGKINRLSFFVILLLPNIMGYTENQFSDPADYRLVETKIIIDAPVRTVWENIVSVKKIQPQEHSFDLVHFLGFPKPVEAILKDEKVGAVRIAKFEGGLEFREAILDIKELERIEFGIKADPSQIPLSTLDKHVTIGGRYFDTLRGKYEIVPTGENQVLLVLSSEYRISTRFNFYSSLWTDFIMRSIQNYILKIIRNRSALPKT
ncbi:hypothetical protein CH373_17510 [Leptospira perolatii]|uniref:Polyketide cyclase n=2 Tax=Leptospira perolatii TaxID=2023191 RepID=A0A2M9ZIE6_9LEPT|nr:hypothetical protein CH360_12355 [Leptospira perolatii]PJZ71782.1 hypothetical protein CH373_17510 [Leptospira perolatii]